MNRLVEPEWLDVLPPLDPRAVRSRADLRRLNEWMRNPQIMAAELKKRSPASVLELGSGDGNFMVRVAKLSGLRDVDITLLDRQDSFACDLREKFAALNWKLDLIQSDVLDFLSAPRRRFDLILCNLFLHHFDDSSLKSMFRSAQGMTDFFVACEPRRSGLSLLMARLLWIIRCNNITRHDAVVSVRAGFRDAEIAELWGSVPDWSARDQRKGLFSHFFKAARGSDKRSDF